MKKKFTMLFAALLACVGVMAQAVANLNDLSNDKVYTLKSGRSSDATAHYLLYHTDAPNNLSSTYSGQGHQMDYSDDTPNFQFAIYKHSDKYYFFNIAAQKFIGNNDNNNGAIPLVDMPTNAIEIRSSSDATYNFVLSTNGTGALNAANTTGCHGVVNWNGGYNNLTDGGNIYLISAVADLDAQLKALIEEKLNAAEVLAPARAAVESASTTLVGAYTPDAVTELSAALAAYDADETSDNFNAVKTAYDALLTSGEKVALAAGEQFTVKCVENTRGYMVYSTVEGKGSETQAYLAGSSYTNYHAAIDAEGIYKEWAIVAHNGKSYMYNVQNKKYINSEGVVKFTDTPCAFEFISIGDNLWEIQFEDNKRYLSFSPGWGADCVRTESGIDNGCKFYIEKTGVAVSEDVVSIVETSFVNEWKNANYATLDYVGGYPTSLREEIEAVSTLAGITAFDNENASARVAFAPGYYFIKSTSADKYATYSSNDFVYEALADGEKLGAKHVMEFVQDGENMKLQVPNLGKSVVLADAAANGGKASKIETEIAAGSNFTVENQGFGKLLVKGDNQVMRTESSGAINYWWGDTQATWYLVPVTELEITINEFASICLPFDVEVEGATAYAVTETATESVTLTEKADIPAGKGAILEGNGTAKLVLATAASDWSDNLLEGTTVATEVEGKSYILANGDNGIGLYNVILTDGKFTNGANKAYLSASKVANAAAAMFSFGRGEGTTGIETAVSGEQAVVIYDLAGRRVEKMEKGIYIINGKKVIR